MLGYITIDRSELKEKDIEKYRAFYCGVCQDLKYGHGQLPRMSLNYDCTFLAILLTSLSYGKTRKEEHLCLLRPGSRKTCLRNKFTAYAADMCVLLVYNNLMDDWADDRSLKSAVMADAIRRDYIRTARKYKRQTKAIRDYIRKLHRVECQNDRDPDLAAGLTGHCFEEIFLFDEHSEWERELRTIGFFLGKFIYLCDAYEDVFDDIKAGRYNPFSDKATDPGFEDKAAEILTMMAASAARSLERLPLIDHIDILRNIMYCGIWTKFRQIHRERTDVGSI